MTRDRARAAALGLATAALVVACGWDPKRPFERFSPEVDKAAAELDAGKAREARDRLGAYVSAAACDGGAMAVLGAADASNASFDLGLALFKLAEQYGRKLDDEVVFPDGGPAEGDKQLELARGDQLDCAKAALDAILARELPVELEARARYLRGNVAFLDRSWLAAIDDYDKALVAIPGLPPDAGDGIGRDAAHNRALALRYRDEDRKRDAGPDGSDADADADSDAPDSATDADADAPTDAPQDRDADAPSDAGDDGAPKPEDDGGKDGGGGDDRPDAGQGDAGRDAGAKPEPTSSPGQDERMLDLFEQAPTFQREESKSRNTGRKLRGSQDK